MTKEEKIKEAYGEYFELLKEFIHENGEIALSNVDYELWEIIEELDFVSLKNGFSVLKSLQGIENNNGWIKIETQADLPKEYTECYFELKNKDIQIGAYVDHKNIFIGIDEQYFPSEIKAYLPIQNPPKRIY